MSFELYLVNTIESIGILFEIILKNIIKTIIPQDYYL